MRRRRGATPTAADMGAHLPPLKPSQSAADDARILVAPRNDDEIEALAAEVAKLTAALAKHAAANPPADGTSDDDSVAGTQSGGGGIPGVINTGAPPCDALSASATSVASATAGGATAAELCAAQFSLLLAGLTNGEAHTPVFIAEFAVILEWTGGRKLQ